MRTETAVKLRVPLTLISELHKLRNSDTGVKVTLKIYNFGLLLQLMHAYMHTINNIICHYSAHKVSKAKILHVNQVIGLQDTICRTLARYSVFLHQQQLLNQQPETGTRVPVSIPVGYPGI